MLIICKAPIFYIAGIFSFYIWIKNKDLRFHPTIILAAILVLINIYSWIDIAQISNQFIKESSKFTISPLQFYDILGWSLMDSITNFIFYISDNNFNTPPFARLFPILAILLYILIKYYAIFFVIQLKQTKSFVDKSLIIYATISLLGILIIRNGYRNIDHQAHAYFLMSYLSCIWIIIILIQQKLNKKIIVTILIIFLIFASPNKFLGIILPNLNTTHRDESSRYLKYHQAVLQNKNQRFYRIKSDEPYWLSELQSQLSGLRIHQNHVEFMEYGQIRYWVNAQHKIIYCSTYLGLTCKPQDKSCNYCKARYKEP